MLFSGHKLSVSALCFGSEHSDTVILGSGSEDCVIVWYLKKTTNLEGRYQVNKCSF